MAKKRTGLSSTLFRGIDPYAQDEEQPAESAAARYPLAAIRPDPGQPRRLLPASLAEELAGGKLTPVEVMQRWLESGAGQQTLEGLQQLAGSIERHGLINPISIRRPGEGETLPEGVRYLIVTGERRYWAHVLLATTGRRVGQGEAGHDPELIRAAVVEGEISVRAHQLIENIMREDINAVEKARGLWALRYELSGLSGDWVNDSSPSREEDEVNDSSPTPRELVPWNRVSDEMGISKRYRIFLTQVLTLSPEAQAIVQEHGLAETTIRPIVQKLRDEPELQQAALQQLVTWQMDNEAYDGQRRSITRGVEELVTRLLQQKAQPATTPDVEQAAAALDAEAQTRRFRRRVRGAIRFLHGLPRPERALLARDLALDAHYADVVEDMHALRDQLDELLQRVDDYRAEEQNA